MTTRKTADSKRRMVFVTVGSTEFEELITSIVEPVCLGALQGKGYTHIVIQVGNSRLPPLLEKQAELTPFHVDLPKGSISVEYYKYKTSIGEDFGRASLVICHGGAGSIMESLYAGRPTITVSNHSLMNDHQGELSQTLHEKRNLVATECGHLVDAITRFDETEMVKIEQPRGDFINHAISELFSNC